MKTLASRRAIVCGSTRGIGRAVATAFAEAGAEVTLLARDAEALDRARRELPGPGPHHAVAVDFADTEALRAAAEDEVQRRGPGHILLNNAGGPPPGPAHDAKPEAYAAAFAQHLLASQVLVQALLPGMREAGYGRIVNIISTSVVTPIRGLGVSNTIRGAVANWARTLASELAADGITVNSILPGFVGTERLASLVANRAERGGKTVAEVEAEMRAAVPAGRFGTPEEIAAVAAFLASPAASYVNGVNLPVDGGRLAAQ